MALYESTFIARQDASAQDVTKMTEKFEKLIKDHKGNLVKKEYWGLRSLAYKVKKNRKGHYTMLAIDAEPKLVSELERQYKLNENVIRFLTIKVDEVSKEASPMMKQAKSGEE